MRCFSKIASVFRKRPTELEGRPADDEATSALEASAETKTKSTKAIAKATTATIRIERNFIAPSSASGGGADRDINENDKRKIQPMINDRDQGAAPGRADAASTPSLAQPHHRNQQQQQPNHHHQNHQQQQQQQQHGRRPLSDDVDDGDGLRKDPRPGLAMGPSAGWRGPAAGGRPGVTNASDEKHAATTTSTPPTGSKSISMVMARARANPNSTPRGDRGGAGDDDRDKVAETEADDGDDGGRDRDRDSDRASSRGAAAAAAEEERQVLLSLTKTFAELRSSFMDEYKTMVDERQRLIEGGTSSSLSSQPQPQPQSQTGEAMERHEESYRSHNNNENNNRKSPEELEYEARVAAEWEDVMTPLPGGGAAKAFALGRHLHLHSEIAEVIRNLDANALRINNLTLEDKRELLRRFESQQRRLQQGRSGSAGRKQLQAQLREADKDRRDRQARQQQQQQQQQMAKEEPQEEVKAVDKDVEEEFEPVELRRRPGELQSTPGLFARRQPKSPKLRLQLRTRPDEDGSERNLMDLKYPTVLPPNPQLKALLVFHKTDNITEVLTEACHRQHLDVTAVKSKEAALETLQTAAAGECFHLIIIDARSSKHLDAEHIARSIRHTNGHHFTTIIAVVKKSFFDKDDFLIALLDAGVNRCMAETTNVSVCNIEIKQILHSIVRPHNVMSTQQALYTALHRLKEVLIITDDVLRIQYANKSAERLLNMRLDEIISKPLADIFVSDVSSISAHGKSIREFDGILTVRRKSQDGIPMHVRVVPVACIGRVPTHFVFNFDVPGGQTDFIATLPQPKEAPRGSLHSIRRGSFDVRSVASDGLRRTSLAKLTSLPLEAPITKIINLLSQVQENCSADEARLIDKVMEFLKREGLYSPQMKEIRTEDPIATDLIGALLTGPSLYSSRRSSNDSIIRVSTSRPTGIMPAKMKATPLIMELLEESLSWEFDMFKLEEITEKRPLLYLGMEMFRRFDVFATFNIDENVCKGWLAVIEANYHAQNSYHNSTHAADVMQATGAFMTQLAAKEMVMDRMDEATALIAAAAHDIDHPGRSSAFLCNSNSPLALLYNDLTVLESHHAATTFKLTLGDDKINIFKNLDKDTYKSVRSTIIDMILATEMTRHFEHLAKFVSVFGTDVEPRDIVQNEDESSILIRRMLIKVADVSNPARPPSYCVEWARRIAEEYFMQTDEEKANALPIVMPMFDRATCSIPKSQIGFIEYIIQDMMHAWDSFIDMPQLITYMQINYTQWKKFEEQGIHTLADIKTKQVTLNAKKTTCK